jgi:hypothetical protein
MAVEIGDCEFAHAVGFDRNRALDARAARHELLEQAVKPGAEETHYGRRTRFAFGEVEADRIQRQSGIGRWLLPGEIDRKAKRVAIVCQRCTDVVHLEHRGEAIDLRMCAHVTSALLLSQLRER